MSVLKTIGLFLLLGVFTLPAAAQCNFRVDLAGKDVRCFGESNGEVTVTIVPVSVSTAPYEIQWFDGSSQDFRNDLPAGTHFVKVTDSYGCFVTEFITIDQPRLLTTSLLPVHVRCFGEPQGRVDLSADGGTTPYFFQWSNGEATEDITTLVAGDYHIKVTDAKGCVANDSVTIEQPDELLVSPSVTGVSCFGGDDGIIRATVFGGVQPFRYRWTTQDTIPDIFNLRSGTHTLTVTDRNQCIKNEDIFVPQPEPLAVSFNVKKVTCFDLPDGDVQAVVTGGTPAYRYKWSNSSFVLGDTTDHPLNLYRDDYTLQVTDMNGCILVDSVRVEEPNPLVINLAETDASCFHKPDGEIDLSISGGTVPYSVLWSTASRAEDIDALLSDTYQVVVVDVLGCTRYGEIHVGQPDSLNFHVNIEAVSCKDQTDGRISIAPTGGTPGYTVNWSTGGSGFLIGELPGDTYSVTLTDAHNCPYEGSFVMPVNPENCITHVGVPNTFTPNGDGINDVWVIRNYEVYPEMEVGVYNKWGKRIFSSTGYPEPWNGYVKGTEVQTGTYYYTIRLNNGDEPFSGTLTIVR
jgi:gliding motility-associated-like protein